MTAAIPLIDIALARCGDERTRRDVARAIDRACRDIGFFVVTGHGVPRPVLKAAYAQIESFFALPLHEKQACRLAAGHTFSRDEYTPYGYSALLEENAFAYMGAHGKPSDCVEKYSTGKLVLDSSSELPFPKTSHGAALRAALVAYYVETEALARELASLLEIGLALAPGALSSRMAKSNDSLRCHAYPARQANLDTDQGMGTHSDSSFITLLTHTSPGIEVCRSDGAWVRLPSMPIDHYVVNIGDLLSHWCGGVYRSTPHRVVLTDEPRWSIVFFKLTDEDNMVAVGNKQMDALFGR